MNGVGGTAGGWGNKQFRPSSERYSSKSREPTLICGPLTNGAEQTLLAWGNPDSRAPNFMK